MSGGATTTYRYDAGWNVLNEIVTGGTKTYVHGPGGILADASGTSLSSGTYRYYAQDHLGSTRGLYDSNIDAVASYEYSPYGEDFSHTGQTATPRYTGHLWDDTADLYWAPYRYYAPSFARWITRDPLGMMDGPNLYAYVGANPLATADPLGLSKYCYYTYVACIFGCNVLAGDMRVLATMLFVDALFNCNMWCTAAAAASGGAGYFPCMWVCVNGATAIYRAALNRIRRFRDWCEEKCEDWKRWCDCEYG